MVEQESLEVNLASFTTNISCETSVSNPACNISWTYTGILLSELLVESSVAEEGFSTKSIITLNVSQHSDVLEVICYAHCGDYTVVSKTEQLTPGPKGIIYLLASVKS